MDRRYGDITGEPYTEVRRVQGFVVARRDGAEHCTHFTDGHWKTMKKVVEPEPDTSPAILTSEKKIREAIERVEKRCEDNSSLHWPDELEAELGFGR